MISSVPLGDSHLNRVVVTDIISLEKKRKIHKPLLKRKSLKWSIIGLKKRKGLHVISRIFKLADLNLNGQV